MRRTKTPSRNKRAFIAAFDCLFSLIIILMVLTPILIHTYYLSISSKQHSEQTRKLSSLLQLSEYYYSIKAAKTSSAQYSMDVYSHSGFLSSRFVQSTKVINTYGSLGLTDFSIHLSPPKILANEQYCVKRKMMETDSQTKDIWFCAR